MTIVGVRLFYTIQVIKTVRVCGIQNELLLFTLCVLYRAHQWTTSIFVPIGLSTVVGIWRGIMPKNTCEEKMPTLHRMCSAGEYFWVDALPNPWSWHGRPSENHRLSEIFSTLPFQSWHRASNFHSYQNERNKFAVLFEGWIFNCVPKKMWRFKQIPVWVQIICNVQIHTLQ